MHVRSGKGRVTVGAHDVRGVFMRPGGGCDESYEVV